MSKVTMIGCDLHDRTMLLKVAVDRGEAVKKSLPTSEPEKMITWVKEFSERHGAGRIVFAYEASGRGFGLYDVLSAAGIECYVLAPTHLPHTTHRRKNKTDEKDAQMILDEIRAHVLAGRKLPEVWVPDPQTRDDREAVRMRLQLGEQRTRIKNQIRGLAKRSGLEFPAWFGRSSNWSRRSVGWLRDVGTGVIGSLPGGAGATLISLVDLYEELGRQMQTMDKVILRLSKQPRYSKVFRKLKLLDGVGTLTAMVFLTELGDLDRFANRRQIGAYLGLAPASFESGERQDRKGRITRQGPSRLRHVLCQAAWAAIRCSDRWRAAYDRIKRDSAKRCKIAIVAVMRQLGITMWQTARSTEMDQLLERLDQQKASAQARQKGAAPSVLAVAPT